MMGVRPSDRHENQIKKAFRNGKTEDAKSHTKVLFNGEVETVSSFEGTRVFATGRMDFWYYDVCVFAVDFDRDMATDFGYTGYSVSTNANIRSWKTQLQRIAFVGITCLACDSLNWTVSPRHNPKSPAAQLAKVRHTQALWVRYCMGAPWVKHIDGDPWFDGRAYDHETAERAWRVSSEINNGQNWRWFTADWVDGEWTKRFIDDAAKKRWMAWRQRREKTA